MILQIKDLRYRYPNTDIDVLKGIDAEFYCGKLYAIMGKSGSGKSTLLAMISGLDTCTGGEILYDGANIVKIDHDDYRAKNIGVIFQSYNLIQNATALENIVLSMNISGSREKDKNSYAYHLLDTVGIDKATAERKILKLSGGEQQRVGIARALSHDPKVIIADEPTGNLDGETENTIMNILQNLAHQDNRCVIIVTHSEKVSQYADEIFYLEDGILAKQK